MIEGRIILDLKILASCKPISWIRSVLHNVVFRYIELWPSIVEAHLERRESFPVVHYLQRQLRWLDNFQQQTCKLLGCSNEAID